MPGALLCGMLCLCLCSPASSHSPTACDELAKDECLTLYKWLCYGVLANFAQWWPGQAAAPPLHHWSAGQAAIEKWWLTGWMWWTPDACRQEFPSEEWREPHWKNTAEEFNLHHQTCHLCSAFCHLSPEAVAPFDLSPHQVCGPVWIAQDSCLFVV